MKKDFDKAVKFTLLREGFISDEPDDPGKLTIFGISSKWYPKEVTHLKKLINEGKIDKAKQYAIDFFYKEFWLKVNCDNLPYPFNLIIFDTAVNCGRSRARKFIDPYDDWRDYLFKRIEYHASLKSINAKKSLRGWINRCVKLYRLIKKRKKV
ncbi:MAG TPA: hypothetical protein ENG48_08445 [Candidatus Atribacteria bacterium]|nr:hypothetical protein [Candidatus Atribacteria bacterium]